MGVCAGVFENAEHFFGDIRELIHHSRRLYGAGNARSKFTSYSESVK